MSNTLSPIGTTKEQSLRLRKAGLPNSTADMYLEQYWASSFGEWHVMDKQFEDYPPEGVDHIESWSLPRLIDLLPEFVCTEDDEEGLNSTQYDLFLDKNYVKYMTYNAESTLYETFGSHTIDAAVDMLEMLLNEGWGDEILRQYNEKTNE